MIMNQTDFEVADELENVKAATVDLGILLPKTKDLYDVFLEKLSTSLNYEGGDAFFPKRGVWPIGHFTKVRVWH